MSKQKTKKPVDIKRKRAIIALVAIVVSLGLMTGLSSGTIQYAAATIACGRQPVVATSFAAAYSYNLPGDPLYSPGPFSQYYCTEQEAIKAGFRHSPLSSGGQAAEEAQLKQAEQEAQFSPDKVSFTTYVPTLNGYSAGDIRVQSMPKDGNQVFFNVKKDGSNVVGVREGAVGSDYQLCKIAEYPCSPAGTDASGHAVIKQVNSTFKQPLVSYMITIGTTFINFEGVPNDFTDTDAITIFNSLTGYKK
jgi:hypothetical protein